MISPTSITKQYILQPTLLEKHRKTLEWLSAAILWKRELAFFQILLDQYAARFTSEPDKKKADHFQNIVLYYKDELVDALAAKLRAHEKRLAEILQTKDETRLEYFSAHPALMGELEAFEAQFIQHKDELFGFIEKAM